MTEPKGTYHCLAEWSSTTAECAEDAAREFVKRLCGGDADVFITVLPDHHGDGHQSYQISVRSLLELWGREGRA